MTTHSLAPAYAALPERPSLWARLRALFKRRELTGAESLVIWERQKHLDSLAAAKHQQNLLLLAAGRPF